MNQLKSIVATGLLCSLVFATTFCKQKKEEDKESTKKDRYREIVDAKAAFALFSTMLKNSK